MDQSLRFHRKQVALTVEIGMIIVILASQVGVDRLGSPSFSSDRRRTAFDHAWKEFGEKQAGGVAPTEVDVDTNFQQSMRDDHAELADLETSKLSNWPR